MYGIHKMISFLLAKCNGYKPVKKKKKKKQKNMTLYTESTINWGAMLSHLSGTQGWLKLLLKLCGGKMLKNYLITTLLTLLHDLNKLKSIFKF